MGEYWKPVNVTKREYIHPHRLGDGLKWGEWSFPGSSTMGALTALIKAGRWSNDDDIRAASDYGGESQLRGSPTEIEIEADEEGDRNLYNLAGDEFADVSRQAAELAGTGFWER